jgi:hypothetical protein
MTMCAGHARTSRNVQSHMGSRGLQLDNYTKVGYNSVMTIEFTASARKHFREDRLDEQTVRSAMAHPLWFAMVDPDDPRVSPPAKTDPPVALMICKRHQGGLDGDLIEILVSAPAPDVLRVFHVMHLGDIWRDYWRMYGRGR